MRNAESKSMPIAFRRAGLRRDGRIFVLWADSFLLMVATISIVSSFPERVSARGPGTTPIWEMIARKAQSEGPGAAIEASRAAVRSQPASLALVIQLTEILIESEGVPRTFAELDALKNLIAPSCLAFAKARVTRATSDNRLAARLLEGRNPNCDTVLDRWARDYERAQIPGVLSSDSSSAVVNRLDRSVGMMATPFLRSRFELQLRSLVVLREVRTDFGPEQLETMDRIVKDTRKRQLRWDEAHARFLAARLYASAGRTGRAEQEYRKSFSIADSLGAFRTAGLARSYLGLVLDDGNRFRDAMAVRWKAAEIFESLDDSLALAHVLTGLGWDLSQTGDASRSLEVSRRALAMWSGLNNPWGRAQALNNLGIVFFNAGMWEEASRNFTEGLEITSRTGNRYQRAMILNNVALLEDRRGRPDRAVEIYRELLAIHRRSGNIRGELDVLNNLGLACLSLGETRDAREFFQSAVDLARRKGGFQVSSTINLAMVLADTGELDAAAESLMEARSEASARGDAAGEATATAWLGRIAQRRQDLDGALRFLTVADSLQGAAESHVSRIPTLIRLGRIQMEMALYPQAMQTARAADSLVSALAVKEQAPAASVLRAEILARQGRWEEARPWTRRALAQWRETQAEVSADFDRYGLEAAFCLALRILVESKRGASVDDSSKSAVESFRLAMEYHNRNLQAPKSTKLRVEPPTAGSSPPDSLPSASLPVDSELSRTARVDSLISAESQWRARIEELRRQITVGKKRSGGAEGLELAEAETAMHACRRAIEGLDPVSSRALAPLLPTVEQLREVGGGSILLSYVLGPRQSDAKGTKLLLIVMRPDAPLAVVELQTDVDLRRKILLWSELLSRPAQGEAERQAELRLARDLGAFLLPSWISDVPPTASIVIAADGTLSNLPFGALIAGRAGTKRRLIEIAEVERCVSLPLWYRSRVRPRRSHRAAYDLVLCGSTTGQEKTLQVSDMRTRYRRSARIALGDLLLRPGRSAPSSTRRPDDEPSGVDWRQARILHIDSHGIFDERRPWRSGLYEFAGDRSDSTRLAFVQQADLLYFHLHNELVTLAACETARAEDSPVHSSMESFAQGLQQAGAQSVLGSYWKVDDAVARWTIQRVYQQLSRGESLGEALRSTKLELMNHSATADPFYWACWVVIGDGAQRISLEMRRTHSATWLWFGLSTVLLILAAVVWRRRTISTS